MSKEVEKDWIFTFGCGQQHAGQYVKIHGTFDTARDKMFSKFADRWCWQYDAEEYFSHKGPKEQELIVDWNEQKEVMSLDE